MADCSRKRRYETEREAEEVAEHEMGLNPGLVLRVYYCAICRAYHLTSKPRRY
jgi:hypothetical protein